MKKGSSPGVYCDGGEMSPKLRDEKERERERAKYFRLGHS